jgi:hypothetical protein
MRFFPINPTFYIYHKLAVRSSQTVRRFFSGYFFVPSPDSIWFCGFTGGFPA